MRLNRSVASTEDAQPGYDLRRITHLRVMTVAALLALQIEAVLTGSMSDGQRSAALAAVTVLAVLQTRHRPTVSRRPRWLRLALLATEGLATYLPVLALGAVWPGTGGFFAASVLLAAPGWAALPLVTGVLTSVFAAAMTLGSGVRGAENITVAGLAIGLVIVGVHGLTSVIKREHDSHTEAAQLAVIRERLRFARDLHDLLGYSLAAITLRAELTRRLIDDDPATAREELREVIDIARQAGTEVRQIADGYRTISLAEEAAASSALLASADITARVTMPAEILPDKIDSVLAVALRELITNALRHSSPRHCWITVTQTDERVTLSVANDGVPRGSVTHRDGGGLENLAWRLEAFGGTLTAKVHDDGQFHVLAEIPVGADGHVSTRRQRTGRSSY